MVYSLDSQYQGLRLWSDAHIYFHIGVPLICASVLDLS